jgi:pimeloyl-ACP methyl ester carboxylesterase
MWRKDFPRWVDDNADPFFLSDTSPGIKDWTKDMMLHTPLRAALALGRTMAEADVRAELKRLDLPVLVIQGDRDASAPLPLTGRRTAALIPEAKLEVYAGAPHGLYFTHAERLNADIAAFARS